MAAPAGGLCVGGGRKGAYRGEALQGRPQVSSEQVPNGQVYQAPGPDGRGVKGHGGVRVKVGRSGITVSREKWTWRLRTARWEGQE